MDIRGSNMWSLRNATVAVHNMTAVSAQHVQVYCESEWNFYRIFGFTNIL